MKSIPTKLIIKETAALRKQVKAELASANEDKDIKEVLQYDRERNHLERSSNDDNSERSSESST